MIKDAARVDEKGGETLPEQAMKSCTTPGAALGGELGGFTSTVFNEGNEKVER